MGNALGSNWALYGLYMGSIKTHAILVAELSQRAFEALPGRARASGNGRGSRSRAQVAGEVGGSRVGGSGSAGPWRRPRGLGSLRMPPSSRLAGFGRKVHVARFAGLCLKARVARFAGFGSKASSRALLGAARKPASRAVPGLAWQRAPRVLMDSARSPRRGRALRGSPWPVDVLPGRVARRRRRRRRRQHSAKLNASFADPPTPEFQCSAARGILPAGPQEKKKEAARYCANIGIGGPGAPTRGRKTCV